MKDTDMDWFQQLLAIGWGIATIALIALAALSGRRNGGDD